VTFDAIGVATQRLSDGTDEVCPASGFSAAQGRRLESLPPPIYA
jgi:hypothetical protein